MFIGHTPRGKEFNRCHDGTTTPLNAVAERCLTPQNRFRTGPILDLTAANAAAPCASGAHDMMSGRPSTSFALAAGTGVSVTMVILSTAG
jgi:hypothetical protein